jgi:hypothetical protein
VFVANGLLDRLARDRAATEQEGQRDGAAGTKVECHGGDALLDRYGTFDAFRLEDPRMSRYCP